MSKPPHPSPLNPTPAFRVGITGTRSLDGKQTALLQTKVAELLALVASAFPGPAELRLLSPLAVGSDRLAARVARAANWRIVAPLPFAQTEYEKDFPGDVEAFQDLLSGADVLELDGDRSDAKAAYEAVGRFVVRNCDLLIAIWDGHSNNGRGGTADIIQFAARANLAIWWLHPDGAPPGLLRGTGDLQRRERAPVGDAAQIALQSMLKAAVTAPDLPPPERADLIGRLVGKCCRMAGRRERPLEDYLAETSPPSRMIWRLHGWFMDVIAPRQPIESADAPESSAPSPIALYWQRLGDPADTLSISYGDRYRSCYLIVFALAATALTGSGLGLAFPQSLELTATSLEALALLGILIVVFSHHLHRFHERWIACRLLAELCRQQLVLAELGWSLPHFEVERLSTGNGGRSPKLPRDAWVAWYFAAARRAAPLPLGRLDAAVARSAKAGLALARDQIAYHTQRRHRSHLAASRLSLLCDVTFLAALVMVLLKFVPFGLEWPDATRWMGFFTAFFPAVSAAAFGVRAYAEYELLADQSVRMGHDLELIAEELSAQPSAGPLASQAVAAELFALAMALLRDTRGWAQLFRMKSVEAG